jgi:hypothetical protein
MFQCGSYLEGGFFVACRLGSANFRKTRESA